LEKEEEKPVKEKDEPGEVRGRYSERKTHRKSQGRKG
jgi:hypothetical protein